MRTATACLVSLAALAAAAPVAAGVTQFATPSRTIGCLVASGTLRCDILRTAAPPPPAPASCEFDWGNAVAMEGRGRARRICHSDTVLPSPGQAVRILAYGTTIRLGAFRCTSRRTGLICRNRSRHGWLLSRERVRLT
jgi:hypothetical protein